MKKCSKCKIEKPISEFNKNSKTKDKLTSYCKICNNQNNSKWFKNNRERRKIYENKKYANDITFKLAKNLRNRLRQALLKSSDK